MAFNINEFRSSLRTEVANPTNYEVSISMAPRNFLSMGLNDTENSLIYRCETCSIPSLTMKTTNRNTYGPVRKVVYGAEYQDVSFSFIVSDSMVEKEYFHLWQKTIVNDNKDSAGVNTNSTAYYDEYIGEITIQCYDKTGLPTYRVTLEEAYPIAVTETQLSWNSNNEYVRVTVNIAYRKAREELLNSSAIISVPDTTIQLNDIPAEIPNQQPAVKPQIATKPSSILNQFEFNRFREKTDPLYNGPSSLTFRK